MNTIFQNKVQNSPVLNSYLDFRQTGYLWIKELNVMMQNHMYVIRKVEISAKWGVKWFACNYIRTMVFTTLFSGSLFATELPLSHFAQLSPEKWTPDYSVKIRQPIMSCVLKLSTRFRKISMSLRPKKKTTRA